MGLKGNLATVSLADVFQALSHGHSTGLLRVQTPQGTRFVEIQDGAVSIVSSTHNRILIGDLLVARGLITQDQLKGALEKQKESGNLLGQVMIELHLVSMDDLEAALRFQVEEEICDLFLLKEAEFDFLANANLDAKMALGGGFLRLKIDPNSLLLEAARRVDEWKKLEKRIRNQASLFRLTETGQEMKASSQGLSPEGLILLELVDERRTVESMVQKACLGRMNTNLLLVELWDAELIDALPIEAYTEAAASHFEEGRLDEAERIARWALEQDNDTDRRNRLNKILQDLDKKRKLGQATSGPESQRVRSEVIRRPNPALIIQRKHSLKPYAIGGVIVLILLVGGGWSLWLRQRRPVVPEDVKRQYDAWMSQINEAVAERDYEHAFGLLQRVPKDEAVREPAKQKYNEVLGFITSEMEQFASRSAANLDARDAAKIEADEKEMERFAPLLQKLEGSKRDELLALQQRFEAWRNELALKAFQRQLAELEKLQEGEAKLERCRELLAGKPPEAVACKLRAQVQALGASSEDALKFLARGKECAAVGDLSTAKFMFQQAADGFPGSDAAKEADKLKGELEDRLKEQANQLRSVDRLILQRDYEKARAELEAFLNSKPDARQAEQARKLLRSAGADTTGKEAEAQNLWREVQKLELRGQADEAHQKKLELAEKFPYSQAAEQATFRLKVTSEPPGAQIALNGTPQLQPTPTDVAVPMLGLTRISVSKEGFETYEKIALDPRERALHAPLLRQAAERPRLMPAPADGGLAVRGDWVAWISGPEAILFERGHKPEEPLARLIPAPARGGKEALNLRYPLFAKGPDVELLVGAAGDEPKLWRIDPTARRARSLELKSAPIAAPLSHAFRLMPNRPILGVPTRDGFENVNLVDGAAKFAADLPGGAGADGWAIAFDEQKFYVPRGDGKLYALDGESGEAKEAALPEQPVGGVAVNPEAKALAGAGAEGVLAVWTAGALQKRFEHKLAGPCRHAPLALKNGFLALAGDKTLDLVSAERDQSLWTFELDAPAVLAPIPAGKNHVAVAAAGELVLVELETGKPAWRARLPAAPVSMTANEEFVFVSTQDGYLRIFEAK
ncbi:MAG: DUF4388 domain-containing protein [Planctomycetota bacterium]|nr:DUF4388 domain-containing protein [Planctomycetota bacterium]